MNASTATDNQQGRRVTTFELIIAELKSQLAEITAINSVEVTHYDDEPTRILLKFKKNEEWGLLGLLIVRCQTCVFGDMLTLAFQRTV